MSQNFTSGSEYDAKPCVASMPKQDMLLSTLSNARIGSDSILCQLRCVSSITWCQLMCMKRKRMRA